jgi:hypothetical protein
VPGHPALLAERDFSWDEIVSYHKDLLGHITMAAIRSWIR